MLEKINLSLLEKVDVKALKKTAGEIIKLTDELSFLSCLFPRVNYRCAFPRVREGRIFVRAWCVVEEMQGDD